MGLQYREFGRRRRWLPLTFGHSWRNWIFTAGSVIAIASAAIWLLRDVRSFVGDMGPAEGSLIVNINTATQAELETVPGIGETRAVQIIAGRPYENVNELLRISGIGEATLESIRPFVTTEGETRER